MSIVGRNILEVYPQLLAAVKEHGQVSSPRGQAVVEHDPVMWTLERPWEWGLFIPGRRLNPFFALAEVVWMWSGKGGVEFISYYNKSFKQFADDGIPYFNGAYGRRVRHAGYDERPFREIPFLVSPGVATDKTEVDQIEHVIRKIKADPQTRQAVISLWDYVKDNITKSKDHPCNNMVYFSLRNGKLNTTVVIRSNDLIWGVPYNMIQFVHLQALVAGSLNSAELPVEMGTFTVMCNNLHYYLDLYKPTLETTMGWLHTLDRRKVSLTAMSDACYKGFTSTTMMWNIDLFDGFVRNVWDSLEAELRHWADRNPSPAWFNTRWMKLQDMFQFNKVPQYWQMVFATMFIYHVRKAGHHDLVSDLTKEHVAPPVRLLINDFNEKPQE